MSEFPNASLIDPSSLFGLRHIGDFIERTQLPSGAIPSNLDNSHDPWDHIESIMGLNFLPKSDSSKSAFKWLIKNQNADGSWYSKYIGNRPTEINKPNGQKTIHPIKVDAFIESLPIHKFFGVGNITSKKMNSLGIFNGFAIVGIAIVFDRVSQAYGKRIQESHGTVDDK